MTTRRVTEILGSVSVEGKAYGPFSATADRPYLEVPAGVADVMAWPVHESDPSLAQAEAEAGEGIHVDEILKANESLKADLDELRHAVGWAPDATVSPADLARNLRGTAETNRDLLEEATARAQQLEAELTALREAAPAAGLPADALARLEGVDGISKKLAQKALEALTAPAAPEADAQ